MQFTKLNIAPYLSKSSRLFIFTALIAGIFQQILLPTTQVQLISKVSLFNTPCNIAQSSLKQVIDFGQLSRRALENGRVASGI